MVLAVGPGVLIPRPETELMVDFAEQVQLQTTTFPTPAPGYAWRRDLL